MSALTSVVLFFVTIRIIGEYWAGVFSIAFALGQQFQTLGAYEMRSFQATDMKPEYSFATYIASRSLTTILMLLCIAGYSLIVNDKIEEAILIILIASFRMFDALEDVFHGAFQQNDKLATAGKMLFFRTLITIVIFSISVFISHDLLITAILTIIASTIALLFLNIPIAKRAIPFGKLVINDIFKLLLTCFPLFMGGFLAVYLINAPKFGLDLFTAKEYQAYYSALFMPALAISLLSSLAFRPLLTRMAHFWSDNQFSSFLGIIKKGFIFVVIISILVLFVSYFLGIPILNYLFNISLDDYKNGFLLLLIGSAFYTGSVILYYGLVVMRKQLIILLGYGIVAIFALVLSKIFILNYGLNGACILYTVTMFATFIIFFTCFVLLYNKEHKIQINKSKEVF